MSMARNGKRLIGVLAAAASIACGVGATPASADFGLSEFDVRFANRDGTPATQAGSHPYKMTTSFLINYSEPQPDKFFPDGGDIKDLVIQQARGFVGSATAVPQCTALDFLAQACGDDTVVGATAALLKGPFEAIAAPVYSLVPPPGVPARLGFITSSVPLVIDVGVKQTPDYNILANVLNIPQPLTVFGSVTQLWGVPADPTHDFARGECLIGAFPDADPKNVIKDGELNLEEGGSTCSANTAPKAFLTVPRACQGPLPTDYRLDAWSEPGAWVEDFVLTHDDATPPAPIGFSGCGKLDFAPEIASRATTASAGTASGLDFDLSFLDEGLTSATGRAQSEAKKIVVALPEGMTVNPSAAEGLGVCTPADLDRETIASAPGAGCPNASKIGSLTVQTPLLADPLEGSVYLAQQGDPATAFKENPFDSLIAIYLVIKSPGQGILVKQAGKVEPDPRTGQLLSTFDDIPQVPFSHLNFHFREGQRAPLISPSTCGTHTTEARFTPWARPTETVLRTAEFQITGGVDDGPCPPGGVPPFQPGFQAGSLNNNAASYSPFHMRLTRRDGDQDMTKFSATLPPGVLGKLAGVDECSEAQIALAKTKSGRAELLSPSCPANSRIGGTLAGAGVGSSLTYVPGQLYLAGPYKGAPLSVVAITPAVAGPFDVGTVVVRVALDLNPKTAEVEVDGAASDPIPHILKGIPLKVRDLRVQADRPNFTLNPTSCDPAETKATLFGSYLDLLSPADDVPVALRDRYQAANCSRLGFKPRLSLQLNGGTRRGAHPSLHAVLRPRTGDANIESAVVRLPRSAFLDQAHIRTICTRVQFAADSCPKGAIYGRVSAFTPLLEDPLQGPIYLRSSTNKLPDLVFDLHGLVDIEASARIDSIRGGIRTSFTNVPDGPISKVVVDMDGGKKGLIVNSRNLCAAPAKASVQLDAHSGARRVLKPLMQARCAKRRG
jgi:hypothetical protein